MLRRALLSLAVLSALSGPALAQGTAYNSGIPITPGVNVPPQAGYRAACSSAGWLRLVMIDGSPYDIYALVGTGGEDGIGVVGVATTGTPSPAATCNVTFLTNVKR